MMGCVVYYTVVLYCILYCNSVHTNCRHPGSYCVNQCLLFKLLQTVDNIIQYNNIPGCIVYYTVVLSMQIGDTQGVLLIV